MKIIDITVPIHSKMPVYPGDTPVRVTPVSRLDKGDLFNTSKIILGSHTGTHLDAPSHLLSIGASVDALPIDTLVGKALVRHVRSSRQITCADLESAHIPAGTERLLIKTSNSELWGKPRFQKNYVYLEEKGARWMADRGIKLIGFDYLSIDPYRSETLPAHKALLNAGVVLLEGLDLRGVPSAEYKLLCLPLRLQGGDGAPARALLMDERDWLRLGG